MKKENELDGLHGGSGANGVVVVLARLIAGASIEGKGGGTARR